MHVCHLSDLQPFTNVLHFKFAIVLLPLFALMKRSHLSALFQFFKTSFASYLSVLDSSSSFSSSFSCSPHLVFNHPPRASLSFNEHPSPSHSAVTLPTEPRTCLPCHVGFSVCVQFCAHTQMYMCECNIMNTSHLCVSC